MPSISPDQMAALKATLVRDFVPHLPPLLKPSAVAAKNDEKNTARALAGFAIAKLCSTTAKEGAGSVVDDGDDFGIDALYYHGATETLYIVQAKLKDASFVLADALAFCQGLKKLIVQDFSGFNANIVKRQVELEGALENCSQIVPVVIHTGAGIVTHAETALADCLNDVREDDDRIAQTLKNFDAASVVEALRQHQAYPRVDAKLTIKPWRHHDQPRKTYFGFVALADLAALFKRHGLALFTKNLRNPLGETEVARAMRQTLAERAKDFVYFNNGVTALCERIEPKDNNKQGAKRLKVKGLSVINGAQTISSAAHFLDKPGTSIAEAQVLLTLIEAAEDSEFGKLVTRARNHQNAVLTVNFAALDDEQERLRRDLAALGLHYAYKADDMSGGQDPNHIRIDEAARALAIVQRDPRYAVWLKKEPGQILDTDQMAYKGLFTAEVTSFRLANAVRLLRYVEKRLVEVERAAGSPERLTYRHGASAIGFVLSKRLSRAIDGVRLIDDAKLKTEMSAPFDQLREVTRALVQAHPRTALNIFRTQAYALPLLERAMIGYYGVPNDARLAAERAKGNGTADYPKALFDYLASMAPQISDLT